MGSIEQIMAEAGGAQAPAPGAPPKKEYTPAPAGTPPYFLREIASASFKMKVDRGGGAIVNVYLKEGADLWAVIQQIKEYDPNAQFESEFYSKNKGGGNRETKTGKGLMLTAKNYQGKLSAEIIFEDAEGVEQNGRVGQQKVTEILALPGLKENPKIAGVIAGKPSAVVVLDGWTVKYSAGNDGSMWVDAMEPPKGGVTNGTNGSGATV